MEYSAIAQFRDSDHAWIVTIGSHYKTYQDAERAGREIVKKYDGGFPHVDWIQVLDNDGFQYTRCKTANSIRRV